MSFDNNMREFQHARVSTCASFNMREFLLNSVFVENRPVQIIQLKKQLLAHLNSVKLIYS